MKKICVFSVFALLMGAAAVWADDGPARVVVTMSNGSVGTATNNLLVYNTSGALTQTVVTTQKGGVSGNGGGVAARGNMVAAVNFVSQSVSIFTRNNLGVFAVSQLPILTDGGAGNGPVSVAFGEGHLYVLGSTTPTNAGSKVASYKIVGSTVAAVPDGVAILKANDKSPAQVAVVEEEQLIVTEKANGTPAAVTTIGAIETVKLTEGGVVVAGSAAIVPPPAGEKDPFGVATSGNNAYVAIVTSNQISLVRNGAVQNTISTGSVAAEKGPNWLALDDDFLFSSDSVAKNIFRYGVFGKQIIPNGVAATFAAPLAPSDVAAGGGMLAVVVTVSGTSHHITIYNVDEDGNLTAPRNTAPIVATAINGVAFVGEGDN